MMRILVQHAKRHGIRTFGTLSSVNQTSQHRLNEALGRNAQVIPVLQQWRQKGYEINPSHVRVIIKKLTDPDQSLQALQVSEWMRKENICGPTPEDFEKMREVGIRMKPATLNSMLSLSEMEENNMANKVLKKYAAEANVKSMARFMRMWGGEEGIKLESETMAAMANAYAKAGSTKKAIEMYGGVAGSKGEVQRLWNQCKKKEELKDDWFSRLLNENEKLEGDMYKTVIASFLKLDDVEGAERVYEQWEPDGPKLDVSIPGLLISRFCAEGKELKVGELISSIRKKRNRMHLRMVRDFILRVVGYVAIGVFFFCIVLLHHLGKLWPWIFFSLTYYSRG